GHAQARIGIDIVGTDKPPSKLVEDGVVFCQKLTRQIEADGIWSIAAYHFRKFRGREFVCIAQCDGTPLRVLLRTPLCSQHPAIVIPHGSGERHALAAEPAPARRMRLIAADARDLSVLDMDTHTAAGATIAAHRCHTFPDGLFWRSTDSMHVRARLNPNGPCRPRSSPGPCVHSPHPVRAPDRSPDQYSSCAKGRSPSAHG